MAQKRFLGGHLTWPILREKEPFRVYVVEPRVYDATRHSEIFAGAITALTDDPRRAPVGDRGLRNLVGPAPTPGFDLVTFPEAFLPWEALLKFLKSLSEQPVKIGCVHVGLRSRLGSATHLIPLEEVRAFADQLRRVPNIVKGDLVPFIDWLDSEAEGHFNLGCLATVDANSKVRVCVHPKMVRSHYELSPHPEKQMTESNLLSLVTLRPRNANLPTVTIQPLICSDFLPLGTDRPNCRPMEAVNTDAACLGKSPPDHIDVVSVATCTPQQPIPRTAERWWRKEFRESFVRTACEDTFGRQNHAIIVLANYSVFPQKARPAGLSGAFIPLPVDPGDPAPPSTASRLLYGRLPTADKEPDWARDDSSWEKATPILGHLMILAGPGADSEATLFGFTVNRLPRRASRWRRDGRVVEITAYDTMQRASRIVFVRRSEQ